METGERKNSGKLKWSLVSWKALEPMIEVLMFGAEKYAPWNWTKGLKYTEISESLQRHLNSFMEGEDDDPESKLSHLGHILCNSLFLSYMHIYRKDMDDRHKVVLKKVFQSSNIDWVVDYKSWEAYKEKHFIQNEKLLFEIWRKKLKEPSKSELSFNEWVKNRDSYEK